MDFSDRIEVEERDPPSPLLCALEAGSQEIFGKDWHRRVDKVFLENLGKYRKYTGDKVLDLLRAMRNKKHHYQELPVNVQALFGGTDGDKYLDYFTKRFPKLLLHAYYVSYSSSLKEEAIFRFYLDDNVSSSL